MNGEPAPSYDPMVTITMTGRQRLRASALRGLAIGALVVLAAACGSAAAEEEVSAPMTPGDSANGAVSTGDARGLGGALSLGQLESGGGVGSAALAGARAIGEPSPLGEGWLDYSEPVPLLEPCLFQEPKAHVIRLFFNPVNTESLGITVNVYVDEGAAAAALDHVMDGGYLPCLDAGLASAEERIIELGVYDTVTVQAQDEVEPTLLVDGQGGTFRYRLEATGPNASVEFETTTTYYVVGQALVGIEASVGADRHQLMTRLAAAMIDDDLVWEPDPSIDDAVDQLRQAVLGPDSPAQFYELFQPATVVAPTDTECEGPGAGVTEMVGPIWATNQGISAIIQSGTSYGDAATAQAAMTALAETDPACVSRLIARRLAGTATYDGGEVSVTTVEGRDVVVADIAMTQLLDGSAVPVDVRGLSTFVQVDNTVVGWQFIGIRGDEPDLSALAVQAAEQLEAARS